MSDHAPTGMQQRRAIQRRFDRIAPRYEQVNRVLAFGMDRRWRRAAAAALDLAQGSVVVDVGCGTGALYRELVELRLNAAGFDLSEGMLRSARRAGPIGFAVADALQLPVADSSADGATCAFALRDVGDPARLLGEIHRVLRPGGRLALLEVAVPARPWARAVHRFYFSHVAATLGGVLSDREAYRYFADSMSVLPSADALVKLFTAVGFDDYHSRTLGGGTVQLVTARRRCPDPLASS